MQLLHRSSMFGGGGRAPRRGGAGSGSPRAPRPPRHQLFSNSDSIKKRSATVKKSGGAKAGSKRARLRAGLAAALQELRLDPRRHKRGPPVSAGATQTELGYQAAQGPCRAADAAAVPPCATAASTASGGGPLLLLLALLALVCVVALGRAPAVCCCTCAAWWCRGSAATDTGRRQSPALERWPLQ